MLSSNLSKGGLRSHDKGFTLIEMLVALAIFSSLVTVLLGGYMQGLSLWERMEKKSNIWQQYQSRASWIRRLSEQIVAADYRVDSSHYAAFFLGNAQGFKAISSFPLLSPAGRAIPVEFRLVSDPVTGMNKLMYREGRRGEDPERGMFLQKPDWIVLFENINNARFGYYEGTMNAYGMAVQGAGEWKNDIAKLPEQISLHFGDQDGRSHNWRFRCQAHSNALPLTNVFGGG